MSFTGMVKFDCNSCGKCCKSFGEFIKIERKLTDRDYYCRYGITNELFLVHIQPDFVDAFADQSQNEAYSQWCPFMRKNNDGKGFICTVYPMRPLICREFQCYRMLIANRNGQVCGRILGHNELTTSDEDLKKVWKDHIAPLPHPVESEHHIDHAHMHHANETHTIDFHVKDTAWINNVITVLAAHGYHGDPVE
jgi:hypothetical protein